MVFVFYEKMLSALFITRRLAYERIFFQLLFCDLPAMAKLPDGSVHGGIVFDMFNISPPFQHHRLQSFLTKFFRSPAATDATSNNNCIITLLRNSFCIGIYLCYT